MTQYQSRREKKKELYKKLGIAAVSLVARIGGVAGVLSAADKKQLKYEKEETKSEDIVYRGKTYTPKGNLETYLFSGIDATGTVAERDAKNPGQCDVLILLVRDRSTEQCKLLTIDRNTITPVQFYGENGSSQGTAEVQISLSLIHI